MNNLVFRLDKKTPAHFYTTLGVVICKNHMVRPLHSFNKYRKILFSSMETFFCRNLENVGMSFLGQCNVEIVPVPGFQGLSCSKTVGWRVVCSKKLSMATFFYFLGQLFGGQLFELFARETNLKKQSSVSRQQFKFQFSRRVTPSDSLRKKISTFFISKLHSRILAGFLQKNVYFLNKG